MSEHSELRRKPAVHRCEADVAAGLESIARQEILQKLGNRVTVPRLPDGVPTAGRVSFTYTGDLRALASLKTVQAVWLLRRFGIPRPKALLGDESFRALLGMVDAVLSLHPRHAFQTLHLSAAGSDSAVMRRLKAELARHSGLGIGDEEGDLVIRIRPARPPGERTSGAADAGWEVLVRLTPRPLATRVWRVCNYEGALNAGVAHAMALLTQPGPADVFLNLACGSATLLVERLDCGPVRLALGCDRNADALRCARLNLAAFGGAPTPTALMQCDARCLPLPDGCVDAVCADLPFGHLVGSHQANLELYPAVLTEAARVARPGARFALITHEVRLMERLLGIDPPAGLSPGAPWSVEQVLRVELGGLYPRIYLLRRAG